MTTVARPYVDPSALARFARICLIALIAAEILSTISTVMEYQLVHAIQNHTANLSTLQADAEASDARQRIVSAITLLVYIATAGGVLRWIHQSNANLHARASAALEYTPGWAVGWYFIPFANLWKPFQVMQEIWRASFDPQNKDVKVPALLPAWWVLWLVTNIVSNISFRLSLADDIDLLVASNVTSLISSLTDIPTALLLIAIIGRVTEAQMRLPAVAASGPPEFSSSS